MQKYDYMPTRESFLEKCMLIRQVEETLLHMFSQGLLSGTVHTCIGQEACAVGTISALDTGKDIIFSNHRGHGHFLAYGGDVKGLLAEAMGRSSGVCQGRGGSQHLQFRNFYTNGIQGASVPIVVGMAFAELQKKTDAICMQFLGDGTFGEGSVYESLNLASLWQVPVLFVVENNFYAQSTPRAKQHAGDFYARAAPFGIPIHRGDGMAAMEVYEKAKDIIDRIRTRKSPEVLILDTYRFSPHSKGDDFRDKAEIDRQRLRDPITLLSQTIDQALVRSIAVKNTELIGSILRDLGAA